MLAFPNALQNVASMPAGCSSLRCAGRLASQPSLSELDERRTDPTVGLIGTVVVSLLFAAQRRCGRHRGSVAGPRRCAAVDANVEESRRAVVLLPISLLGVPLPSFAESGGAQETIAEMTKSILGPDDDVYYPPWFLGDWQATTELAAIDFPQGESLAGKAAARERKSLGTAKAIEQYPQRYMEYSKHVIADRAFNMRGYIRGSGGGPRAFESVDWDSARPNTTTVIIKRDGISVKTETRITRRSVAVPDGREDLFNTSEVFQQLVSSSAANSALPQEKVTPIRCVNKFKRITDSEIQVLQRLEVFPRLDSLSDGSDPEKPTVVYKYRGVLKKEGKAAVDPTIRAL